MRRLVFPLSALLVVVGCQSYPTGAPGAALGEVHSGATIRVQPVVSRALGYRTLDQVLPYDEGSIEHLTVQLFKLTDDQGNAIAEAPVKKADNSDMAVDMLPDAAALPGNKFHQTVSFSNLKPKVTYRVRAFAYRMIEGVDTVISTTAESVDPAQRSYVDVAVGGNDTPALASLRVRLKDKLFDGRASSAGITVTPGGLNPVANETIN